MIYDGFGKSLLLSNWFLGKYKHTMSQNTELLKKSMLNIEILYLIYSHSSLPLQ